MGKLGSKISKGFKKLGSKHTADQISNLGKKVIHQVDIGERKFVNSIDKVAPAVAFAADLYAPGSGEGILKANDALQSVHKDTRGLLKANKNLFSGKKSDDHNEKVAAFGDGLVSNAQELNRSKNLLRDAGKKITAPRNTAPASLV